MHIAVGDKPTKRPNFLNLLMGNSIYNALPGKPMRDHRPDAWRRCILALQRLQGNNLPTTTYPGAVEANAFQKDLSSLAANSRG